MSERTPRAYRARIPETDGAIGWTGPWRATAELARSDIEDGIHYVVDTASAGEVTVLAAVGRAPCGLRDVPHSREAD